MQLLGRETSLDEPLVWPEHANLAVLGQGHTAPASQGEGNGNGRSPSNHFACWLKTLSPKQWARVRAAMFERSYCSGTTVFRRGDKIEAWIGIAEGLLHPTRETRRGKTIDGFPALFAGSWFGEDGLIHGDVHASDINALRDCRLVFMPRTTFIGLLNESIAFNRFVIEQQGIRLRQFKERIEVGSLHDPEARIARCLAALGMTYGTVLRISQEELGRVAGLSRQRTNGAIQRLEQQGLVTAGHCSISLVDLKRLRTHGD